MEYIKQKDKIIIKDCNDFNPEHILECGQVFTYTKNAKDDYNVFSKDKFAHVVKVGECYEIQTDDTNYFENYFDLATDYSKIKQILVEKYNLTDAVNFGYGIRILKQDILEVIFGFIISANNNIERIKKIMAKLRSFGQNKGEYHAFPTLDELCKITEQDYKNMGAGYRAKYLALVAKQLKVADCILLFGYKRCASFPVDTWIEKVYFDLFNQNVPRSVMSKNLINYFGDLSGYAQQYLFYYKRSM